MAIRDLGYQPYQGERLPPSHNTWVLLRYGLRRAWGSGLVKISIFTGWVPTVVVLAYVGFSLMIAKATQGTELGSLDVGPLRSLFTWQLWLFVTLISTGAGASAIAEDLTHKAFQFYFAKPVTPPQYLAGRVAAVSFYCLLLTLVPAFLVVLAMVGVSPPEARLEQAGLILPSLLFSTIIAVVIGAASVGISSLSKSRALTMSAWLLLFIVPQALGAIIEKITDWPWLLLTSVPALLGVLGDSLFKIETVTPIRWFHAAPVLLLITGASLAVAFRRLRTAEVIV